MRVLFSYLNVECKLSALKYFFHITCIHGNIKQTVPSETTKAALMRYKRGKYARATGRVTRNYELPRCPFRD